MKMDSVVHFEMPYGDHKRVTKFYSEAFGWKMEKLGQEMGNYILAGTAETDEKRMIKKPGTVNGGFYPLDQTPEAKYPSIVIAVGDIKESMKKIEEAGGKMLGKPMEIKGIGLYVSFTDTEGNRASILEPKNM